MPVTPHGRAALLLAAAAAMAAGACGSQGTSASPVCSTQRQCAATEACVGGSCIPLATPPGTWGVELVPPSDSPAAVTEFNAVIFGNGPLSLMAEPKASVDGSFSSGPSTPAAAHVIVTVPSEIPGRPDLQFEADVAAGNSVDPGAPAPRFVLSVPEQTLQRAAVLQLIPTAPEDLTHPPVTFHVPLDPVLRLPVPAETYVVTGRLFDAIGDPQMDYVARVFRDGRLVSNVSVTNNAGAFSLAVPVSTVGAAPQGKFTVEIKPRDAGAAAPRFSSQPFSLSRSLDLGTLNLAAYGKANLVFRFNVRGGAEDGPAVGGAVVRAQTLLGDDGSTGATDYLRDAQTRPDGTADLTLLPGTAVDARPYAVAVIPPVGSDYGVLCLSDFAVAAGGTANAPAGVPTLVLPRRPEMGGIVVDAGGHPVGDVVVVATRTAAAADSACAGSAGAPIGSATTKPDGTFSLRLDPGTYQLDFDPPAGSPVPRLTESGVVVLGEMIRMVKMPQGALVEGDALGPGGTAKLPSAAVRLYELRCAVGAACPATDGTAPLLRGQTRADANGHFRAVIPLPP